MQFNEYLKTCREQKHLTQEQLVQNLYNFDMAYFEGLDTSTLSKWERGITKPKPIKQVRLIKYFQSVTGSALPCLEHYSTAEAEEMICQVGMKNLLGNSKKLILNFPSRMIAADELTVTQLRNSEMIDQVIEITMDMDRGLHNRFAHLTAEHFKKWAMYPSNSFFVCQYKEQFFGLLFTLRLKPEIFEKVMNVAFREEEITEEHFASMEESASNYIIAFFAMNDKAATMLFVRYYAHLIANQKVIDEVGVAVIMDDARKLLKNMNFRPHINKVISTEQEIQTYRETLPNFLASEYVLKMILSKQECPEE